MIPWHVFWGQHVQLPHTLWVMCMTSIETMDQVWQKEQDIEVPHREQRAHSWAQATAGAGLLLHAAAASSSWSLWHLSMSEESSCDEDKKPCRNHMFRKNHHMSQTRIRGGWLVSAELHWQMDKVVVNCETFIVLVTVSGDDNGTMWISLPRLAVSELLLAQLKTRSRWCTAT